MTSLRKVISNRNNAQQSTGPRSRAGKFRSSRNATKHGLSRVGAEVSEISLEDLEHARLMLEEVTEAPSEIRELAIKIANLRQIQEIRLSMFRDWINWCRTLQSAPGSSNSRIGEGDLLRETNMLARSARYEQRAVSQRNKLLRQILKSRSSL
jgi:hypothetical protein